MYCTSCTLCWLRVALSRDGCRLEGRWVRYVHVLLPIKRDVLPTGPTFLFIVTRRSLLLLQVVPGCPNHSQGSSCTHVVSINACMQYHCSFMLSSGCLVTCAAIHVIHHWRRLWTYGYPWYKYMYMYNIHIHHKSFQVMLIGKERKKERRWTKLKFSHLVFSTLIKISRTYKVG